MSEYVRLTLPADADTLHVLRTVVAAIGARAALTLDDLDDLAIAAEEAMLTLIDQGGDTILLTAAVGDTEVVMEIASDGDPDRWPPPDLESGISWKVLTGLAGDVRLTPAGTAPGLSFRKRSGAA